MTATDPARVAATLSGPMRRALAEAEPDLFGDREVAADHGMTMKALRTRRIITRSRPPLLTPFGRAVIAADRSEGGAECDSPAPGSPLTLPQAEDHP